MKLILSLIFILSISCSVCGQLGYLGNRVGIELGVGTNYAVIKSNRIFHNYSIDDGLLLPKISFGIHRENRKGTIIHLQTIYNQLPNSQINAWKIVNNGPTKYNTIDTAWTQSDNLQLSLGWRKFRELAPLGLYFEFQMKSNIVFNETLYRSESRTDYTDFNYYESSVKYKESKQVSVVPEIGFAMGATYPLNDLLVLDIGAKFNLTLGKFRDKDGDIDEIPKSVLFHRILSSRKLFTTNFLELYVNIILFP
ncbi:MAG: hypothetical protein HRT58_06470 [Crocinitomicaceae bacterium]|nr:hypothetical protein [Flavobacteriales bacterium]NQZ35289.1 hypothetical protein [Crocinitomicaceae bacterium]